MAGSVFDGRITAAEPPARTTEPGASEDHAGKVACKSLNLQGLTPSQNRKGAGILWHEVVQELVKANGWRGRDRRPPVTSNCFRQSNDWRFPPLS